MRYVTNEQRRRRTLFKPTPWAVASWLIFGVAHSLSIDPDTLVVRALKISQLTDGGMSPTYDSITSSLGFRTLGATDTQVHCDGDVGCKRLRYSRRPRAERLGESQTVC